MEKLYDKQSMMDSGPARMKLVWEIDKKLQEDAARPMIFQGKSATCWQPYVKDFTTMTNSVYNGWRMEDVWLDK
jgi:peptide/nickel transport system substrate-binding protein